jgi:hypothetical protein
LPNLAGAEMRVILRPSRNLAEIAEISAGRVTRRGRSLGGWSLVLRMGVGIKWYLLSGTLI